MPVSRRVIVVDNSAVARRVGGRIREARVRDLVSEDAPSAGRLEADILLASGQHAEALDRYDALLVDAGDRRLRAELLRGKAEALCRLHRGGEAIAPASEAVELFGGIGLE